MKSGRENGENPRVVVASKDLFSMLALQSALEQSGLTVIGCAADGPSAVHAARKLNPDAVLVDLALRNDAVSVAEKLTESRTAPVILMCGEEELRACDPAANRVVAGFLAKPLQQAEALPAVVVAVEKWREMVEVERRIAQLKRQLATREAVDSAKCILMDRYGWREAEAYRYIQTVSMHTRRPMAQVAERLVAGRMAVVQPLEPQPVAA